jgi:hypothetical protein
MFRLKIDKIFVNLTVPPMTVKSVNREIGHTATKDRLAGYRRDKIQILFRHSSFGRDRPCLVGRLDLGCHNYPEIPVYSATRTQQA